MLTALKQPVIRYRVLVSQQLSAGDVALVSNAFEFVAKPDDAKQFVDDGSGLWAWRVVDRLGRVCVLVYKGVEVGLFCRLETYEQEPFPGDPLPAGRLAEREVVWVKLPLVGIPKRIRVAALKSRLEVAEARAKSLGLQVVALEAQLEEAENQAARYRNDIQRLEKRLAIGRKGRTV